jgi:hypothetical protein
MMMMILLHSQQRCEGLVVLKRLANCSRACIADGVEF